MFKAQVAKLKQSDEAAIQTLLEGRRIVKAETGSFTPPGTYSWAAGRLTLDDGTQILVAPNEGCGGCPNGAYDLEHLASVDNIITSVRLDTQEYKGGNDSDRTRYRIFVIADAVEINVVSVDGDDGNGYYGTGYQLFVVPADRDGN